MIEIVEPLKKGLPIKGVILDLEDNVSPFCPERIPDDLVFQKTDLEHHTTYNHRVKTSIPALLEDLQQQYGKAPIITCYSVLPCLAPEWQDTLIASLIDSLREGGKLFWGNPSLVNSSFMAPLRHTDRALYLLAMLISQVALHIPESEKELPDVTEYVSLEYFDPNILKEQININGHGFYGTTPYGYYQRFKTLGKSKRTIEYFSVRGSVVQRRGEFDQPYMRAILSKKF